MRKVLLIAVASCALIALVPATALAKHGDRRHHHHARHAPVRHRTFGHDQGNGGQGQPAGTVVSFTNGVLTIMANGGNNASGRVTSATELRCERAEPAEFEHHDRGRGGDGGGGNDRGDDQGDNDNGEANEMCTRADLVPGAVVHAANLAISPEGATWDEVELIAQSSGSSDS